MRKTISIFGYVGMVAGLLGALVMQRPFFVPGFVVVVQAVAVLLFFWARLTFGRRSFHVVADPTAGGLVTSGPYQYIRHPIYTAMCLFTLAGLAGHCSWGMGLCAGLVLASALARIFCEETLVTARYPEYGQYAARTWRMVPYVY
jgi:protein-S-isoprenylcysteine O-methyltransferase Ste14